MAEVAIPRRSRVEIVKTKLKEQAGRAASALLFLSLLSSPAAAAAEGSPDEADTTVSFDDLAPVINSLDLTDTSAVLNSQPNQEDANTIVAKDPDDPDQDGGEQEEPSLPTPTATVVPDIAMNIRSGPGTDYDSIGNLEIDREYDVDSRIGIGEDTWLKLSDGGWIAQEYGNREFFPQEAIEGTGIVDLTPIANLQFVNQEGIVTSIFDKSDVDFLRELTSFYQETYPEAVTELIEAGLPPATFDHLALLNFDGENAAFLQISNTENNQAGSSVVIINENEAGILSGFFGTGQILSLTQPPGSETNSAPSNFWVANETNAALMTIVQNGKLVRLFDAKQALTDIRAGTPIEAALINNTIVLPENANLNTESTFQFEDNKIVTNSGLELEIAEQDHLLVAEVDPSTIPVLSAEEIIAKRETAIYADLSPELVHIVRAREQVFTEDLARITSEVDPARPLVVCTAKIGDLEMPVEIATDGNFWNTRMPLEPASGEMFDQLCSEIIGEVFPYALELEGGREALEQRVEQWDGGRNPSALQFGFWNIHTPSKPENFHDPQPELGRDNAYSVPLDLPKTKIFIIFGNDSRSPYDYHNGGTVSGVDKGGSYVTTDDEATNYLVIRVSYEDQKASERILTGNGPHAELVGAILSAMKNLPILAWDETRRAGHNTFLWDVGLLPDSPAEFETAPLTDGGRSVYSQFVFNDDPRFDNAFSWVSP